MHFIETVWVEDQDGKVLGLRRLSPSEPGTPTLYFDIPMGTTAVTPYALCNKELGGPSPAAPSRADACTHVRLQCLPRYVAQGLIGAAWRHISWCSNVPFWSARDWAPELIRRMRLRTEDA